jgi:hypothetical protein
MKYHYLKDYAQEDNRIFYCEYKEGGWHTIDPVFSVMEANGYITVRMTHKDEQPRMFPKSMLSFWSVLSEDECYVYDGKVFPFPK